jgi:hypothetical protein
MKEFGFPGKCVRMVHLTIKHSICSIRVQLSLSTHFGTTNSLKRGDEVACLLFNVALHKSYMGFKNSNKRGHLL